MDQAALKTPITWMALKLRMYFLARCGSANSVPLEFVQQVDIKDGRVRCAIRRRDGWSDERCH